MASKLNIAIAGATGFVGLELIKKIYAHPSVEIKYLFVKESIDENIYENLPKEISKLPKLSKIDLNLINKCDVFFASLPHSELHKVINDISEKVIIIDLSADFRLPNSKTYQKWYNTEHKSPNLLNKAVYGLSEIYRDQIKSSDLIACSRLLSNINTFTIDTIVKNERY